MGNLSYQMPRGGDEKRGQMPRPQSTLMKFSVSVKVCLCNSVILIKARPNYS